eukprot:6184201-Pleurochrysis_carterae.AAC.2
MQVHMLLPAVSSFTCYAVAAFAGKSVIDSACGTRPPQWWTLTFSDNQNVRVTFKTNLTDVETNTRPIWKQISSQCCLRRKAQNFKSKQTPWALISCFALRHSVGCPMGGAVEGNE